MLTAQVKRRTGSERSERKRRELRTTALDAAPALKSLAMNYSLRARHSRRRHRACCGRRPIERGHHELQVEGFFADARVVVAQNQDDHGDWASSRAAHGSGNGRRKGEPSWQMPAAEQVNHRRDRKRRLE